MLTETQLNWIKHGQMGGSEDIRKVLFRYLPKSIDAGSVGQRDYCRSLFAEMWLLGISKEDFIKWSETYETNQTV